MMALLFNYVLALSLTPPPAAARVKLAAAVAKCGAAAPGDRLVRVTVSDIATNSGIDLAAARVQLAGLSAEVPGSSMEVSKSGVLVYAFPRGVVKQVTRLNEQRERLLLSNVRSVAQACIGLVLLASVATVRPLIDRRVWADTERVSLRCELQMLRTKFQPGFASGTDQEQRPSRSLALECCRFMFGEDGGARAVAAEQRERQYAAIATAIRANKGAVCADQLRPFLLERPSTLASRDTEEAAAASSSSASLRPVEEWVLPILARFDGQPSVTDDGEIVFLFPELLPTTERDAGYGLYPTSAPLIRGAVSALRSLTGPQRGDYLEEPYRRFLVGGDARQVFAVAAANWVAVVLLGALLGPWQLALRMRGGGYAASALVGINVAYGALLVNGFSWIILPAVRRLNLWGYNLGVRRRNRLRQREAARLVDPLQPAALRRRLQAVRSLGQRGRRQVKAGSEALYTTAKSLLEQADAQPDPAFQQFDERLQRKTGAAAGDAVGNGRRKGPRLAFGKKPREGGRA
jgi:hypothetical protein